MFLVKTHYISKCLSFGSDLLTIVIRVFNISTIYGDLYTYKGFVKIL